jgi:glyoxylase-like metal-dependent hydrolase (beta-lactamase superfamily II)
MTIYTLDLNFQSIPESISGYVLPHRNGAALVECGPSSTRPALLEALHRIGYTPNDVTDVFLTHIHLDHAGGAGWWARQGATIHVHANGAPHLLNPEKLIASATRIYGDQMETLWGEFLPVPEAKLHIPQDSETLEIGGLRLTAYDAPGHANHHLVYLCEKTCFSGDVGGIRVAGGARHVRLPTPPPEFHIETWRATLDKLEGLRAAGGFERVAVTHFGIFDDAAEHLAAVKRKLTALEEWMQAWLPKNLEPEDLRHQLGLWERQQAESDGLAPERAREYEAANPVGMSADGVARYWRKYRSAG